MDGTTQWKMPHSFKGTICFDPNINQNVVKDELILRFVVHSCCDLTNHDFIANSYINYQVFQV